VTVRLRASEPEIQGRSAAGNSVPSINLPELKRLSGLSGTVITGAYGQLVAEDPSSESGVLAARPERDEGPHLSYALQWYVFILIAGIGVIYAARQEYRGLNAEGESVKREDAKRAERKLRRGPSDAEEEDALLG
jgi:cytochrome oxidase assembly protein ShyY1